MALDPLRSEDDKPPRPAAKGKRWVRVTKAVNGIDTEVWEEVADEAGGAQWGARESMRLISRETPRVEGPDKVTGRAVFTHDVRLPGMAYACVLRSRVPAAKVTLDLSRARQIPGVLAAIELGDGEVRWLGRPIAAVAATTPEIAEDGVRAILATYEEQPFALTPEQAAAENAPKVNSRGNVRVLSKNTDSREVDQALEASPVRVKGTWKIPVQHHATLETHGAVVDYRGGAEATVYASTQGTFTISPDAAGRLGLRPNQVTAVVEHMGGGFGSKFGMGIEGEAACLLAKELARPVHLMLDRASEFHAAGNRSGGEHQIEIGVGRDGKILAFKARVTRHGGVAQGSGHPLPYIYARDNAVFVEDRCIHTNMDASRAMRGPGHPQASFSMEGAMDECAYAVGMDLLEFRRINLPDAKRALYMRQLERCAELIGWRTHPHTRAPDLSDAEVKVGIGFAIARWGGGGNGQCKVEVRIAQDGSVEVLSGTQDLGTGTRTYCASIVAEELGLELAAVRARIGRSTFGSANASGGSTTSASLAPSVKHAAHNARLALFEKVAPALGATASELEVAPGEIRVAGSASRRIAWKDACAVLGPAGLSAQGEWQAHLAGNDIGGAQAAKVSVDTLTGEVKVLEMVAVQDCGLVLNRLAAVSQLQGGMVQSLSYGLFEERVVDPDLGLFLNANFEDYKIAGAQDIPAMKALFEDDPRGVIGMSEAAIIPGHSAIANAIHNACGVRLREMPLTADKILMGLEALKRG
ncbi:MAG: xanthine dehydrogenase family protein molybdopterin-binding subunit [Planctomycetes bacterium]|nr:xanthine dehydrogenase family protein molybdopterin-binding subunit [Planctomycetota bacterium]